MAFVTGTATTLSEVITAIATLAQSNGWVIDRNVGGELLLTNSTPVVPELLTKTVGVKVVPNDLAIGENLQLHAGTSYAAGSDFDNQPGAMPNPTYLEFEGTAATYWIVIGDDHLVVAFDLNSLSGQVGYMGGQQHTMLADQFGADQTEVPRGCYGMVPDTSLDWSVASVNRSNLLRDPNAQIYFFNSPTPAWGVPYLVHPLSILNSGIPEREYQVELDGPLFARPVTPFYREDQYTWQEHNGNLNNLYYVGIQSFVSGTVVSNAETGLNMVLLGNGLDTGLTNCVALELI